MKLLALVAVLLAPLTLLADPAKWEAEIGKYTAVADKAPKGAIVFTGSSTIRLWSTLAKDYPDHTVLNRGFGGSQMEDSAFYVEKLLVPLEPAQIIIFAGTNDINAKRTPEQVNTDFRTFMEKVKKDLPKTSVALIEVTSCPARWAQREQVIKANELLKASCTELGATFIEVRSKLLGEDGAPRAEIFREDRVHLNADGYKILADTVRPFLLKK